MSQNHSKVDWQQVAERANTSLMSPDFPPAEELVSYFGNAGRGDDAEPDVASFLPDQPTPNALYPGQDPFYRPPPPGPIPVPAVPIPSYFTLPSKPPTNAATPIPKPAAVQRELPVMMPAPCSRPPTCGADALPIARVAKRASSEAELSAASVATDSDSDDAPKPQRRGKDRNKFSAAAIEFGVRVVAEANPYTAPHGRKGHLWKQCLRHCQQAGHFEGASVDTFKHKITALVDAHKEGFGVNSPLWVKNLPTTTQVTCAALLERILHGKEHAQALNDEEKEKRRRKDEEDKVGGEEIRRQSMQPRRKRAAAVIDIDNSDSDSENRAPIKKARKLHAGSSVKTIGKDDSVSKDISEMKECFKEMVEVSKANAEAHTRAMEGFRCTLERALCQNGASVN